jgi:HEAT repeat protein
MIGVRSAGSIAGVFILLIAGACGPDASRLRSQLESRTAAERIQAIVRLGSLGDRESVPALVERLEDEDSAVRFYAIQALERLTGERRGYHYWEPVDRRRAAVLRWRAYLRERAADSPQTARRPER